MNLCTASVVVAASLLIAACGTSSTTSSTTPDASADGGIFGARPYTLFVPDAYDATKPTPLIVMLHGYGASGALEEAYMNITAAAQKHTFLYAYADGTVDSKGSHFWNADDACCNFDSSKVDDVAYIDAILDDIAHKYTVDAKRIFVVGHSNGAFMANRYACDRAARVAGIVSLAGAVWSDPAKCQPTEPVTMLQVHGDLDKEILYDGGSTGTATYPSAHGTVATWATKNGCTQPLTKVGTLDLDVVLPANETTDERYSGCNAGSAVGLWTIAGAGHLPSFGTSWGEEIYAFLSAHPKP